MTRFLSFDSNLANPLLINSFKGQKRKVWVKPQLREIIFRSTAGSRPSDKNDGAGLFGS
jgi:hypothetical protein